MAETPPIRKFMFDKSFDNLVGVNRAPVVERKPVTLKPEQVDAMKKQAYDEGFTAGIKTTGDEQAQRLTLMVSQLEGRLTGVMQNIQDVHKAHEAQLRTAVLTVARKILPDFTARNGVGEIEALLSGAIGDMLHEPRLVVRIHESEFDTVNAKITEITAQKAYAGKVVVLADPEVAAGDCRIEWADGGIERNTDATWRDIENAVAPDQNSVPKPDPTPSQE